MQLLALPRPGCDLGQGFNHPVEMLVLLLSALLRVTHVLSTEADITDARTIVLVINGG